MRTFLVQHAQHPKIDMLLTALEEQDTEKEDKLIGAVSADGWKEDLSSMERTNTKSMFRYLAKEEARCR